MKQTIKKVTFHQFLYQIKAIEANHFDVMSKDLFSLEDACHYINQHSICSEGKLQSWIALYHCLPQVDLTQVTILFNFFDKDFCRQHHILPFCFPESLEEETDLCIAMTNPLDYTLIDQIVAQTNRAIKMYLVDESILITQIMQRLFGLDDILNKASEFVNYFTHIDVANSVDTLSTSTVDMSAILTAIVQKAFYHNVSDIHIEANSKKISVIFRMNNILTKQLELPVKIAPFLLRHVILKGSGDVDQNLKPQDLSFNVLVGEGKSVQIRASVVHILNGYSLVLRLLFSKKITAIETFVSHPELIYHLKNNYLKAGGLLLIAGPPSQGKTTMLYHIIQSYNQTWPIKKIITVEDPIEILLEDINQVSVIPEQGLDFHDMIRASLRQNPDILMIGELRDSLSASMAIRAALTGLPILTTIHARNTPDIVSRLQNLDLTLPVLSKCISILISARLVNILCTHCRIQQQPSIFDREKIKHMTPNCPLSEDAVIYIPSTKGCQHCFSTGYMDRKFMIECLIMNDELRDALLQDDFRQFQTLAYAHMRGASLKEQLMELFLKGEIAIMDLHET